ncbi:cold-shock protein [Microvirga sp. KLBC 81]|uniref:cold-shock protein n=1 Tax=Microvirga sp. KLBC 81 TaxID=1862707 RepID=UPI000D512DF1|nr:cold shock domain-containing protein [Microvirga sp. KLBC 81]PVE21481.1 cold-shock protein [Microvirga sp. KLBC 81]
MMTDKVKSYDEAEGFGFIQPDDAGQDVFVNAIAVERAGLSDLVAGQMASFDTFIDRRSGMIAIHDVEAA